MESKTIEQELELHGRSFFQTVGDSMEPILHNRKSTVVIEKKTAPLKRYDVALYRRPSGEYVLHRVIKVLDGRYLICGDNRIRREYIPEEWIIGVMSGFYEGEENTYISCQSRQYNSYMKHIWRRYLRLRLRDFRYRLRRKLGLLQD